MSASNAEDQLQRHNVQASGMTRRRDVDAAFFCKAAGCVLAFLARLELNSGCPSHGWLGCVSL